MLEKRSGLSSRNTLLLILFIFTWDYKLSFSIVTYIRFPLFSLERLDFSWYDNITEGIGQFQVRASWRHWLVYDVRVNHLLLWAALEFYSARLIVIHFPGPSVIYAISSKEEWHLAIVQVLIWLAASIIIPDLAKFCPEYR